MLALSALFQGSSFFVALRQLLHPQGGHSDRRWDGSMDPAARTILAEDSRAGRSCCGRWQRLG